MAKSKSKKQRSTTGRSSTSQSSSQSSLPSKPLDDSASSNADADADDGGSSFTMIASAAADASTEDAAAATRHRRSNSARRSSNLYINHHYHHHHHHGISAVDDDNEDEYDIRKWTSRHYDNNDDNDGNDDAEVERDLYDPNITTKNKRSLFDDGKNGGEGADEDGVFLSLEVIPGDAYRVEKSGRDTAGGYVTKVVYNTDSAAKADSEENMKEKEEEKKNGGMENKIDKKKERRKKQKEKKKEMLKRKMMSGSDIDNDHDDTNDDDDDRGVSTTSTKKKRTKLSTGSNDGDLGHDTPISEMDKESNMDMPDENDEAITNLRTSWSIHAPGIVLHTTLCAGLVTLGYDRPTPIQSSSLPAAMLGRRDIVGAAPTGSGKTLGYGLPILQYLLEEADGMKEQDESATKSIGQHEGDDSYRSTLQALILVPTRELAMQVTSELTRVSCNKVKIGTIVGGFAEVKQRRTLEKVRPPIVVATPGRLWELMSSKEYTHLNNLAQLRFLVIDEADRMIKQGSFPQLQQIFEVINRANPPPSQADDSDDNDSELDDDNDDHRLKSLLGVRGEAKVVMLNDSILAAIERERNNGGKGKQSDSTPVPIEMDDAEFEQQMQQIHNDDDDDSEIDFVEEDDNEDEPVHRQTFIYSATLTLPPSMHHLIKKDHAAKVKSKKKKGSNKQPTTVDGAIAEILDVAGARGEMKIVDLSNSIISSGGKKGKFSAKDAVEPKGNKAITSRKPEDPSSLLTRLPPGLTLGEIRCAQMHKDSHLYAYLVTTRQGSSGPCLVFCNSIAAVRRVGETLKTLGLPAKMLHAQMAQKSRLAALESLRTANSRSIVVASDVAARGLDIASVTTVIHYDVARVVDTFIHRAGRTARGVGEKAIGTSISLVAPAEEREHQKICEAVRGSGSRSLESVQIDVRLLNEAQERVALASKIVSCHDVESQASKKNKWLQDAAKDAELELDEDMMEGGLLDGDQRDRQRFLEAKRAKSELQRLLAKPMRKQHFGKFLSGVGVRESIKSEGEVKPYIVKESSTGVKHRRKQSKKRESKS